MIRDMYHDPSFEGLQKIASALPENVLDAELESQDVIPEKYWAFIDKTAGKKYFPINNSDNAILSYAYLHLNKEAMYETEWNETKSKIEAAMRAFGISDARINKIAEEVSKVVAETKKVPEDSDARGNYKDWKSYILKGARDGKDGVVSAINKFTRYHEELDPKDAYEVAKELLALAKQYDVPVPRESILNKYHLVDSLSFSKKANAVLRMRLPYYKPEMKQAIIKVASELQKYDPEKVAYSVYEMDKMAGIVDLYGSRISNPFLELLGRRNYWLEKKASEVPQLTDDQKEKLKQVFSEDFVKIAEQDILSAFRRLGKIGKKKFREIVPLDIGRK